MLFSSNVFLFAYLPIVLLVYYLCPRVLRNPVLLLVSLVFYGWGEPVYLLLMVFDILLNYLFGYRIHVLRKNGRSAKATLIAGVAANLLLLGYFKYAGFLLGLIPGVPVPRISLPVGISFYIFQSMSYIIDVYRNDAPVQRNPLTFGTYVSLFPQLIAGPIVRYHDVAAQLESRQHTLDKFSSGILLFTLGLAKKVLLANPMGALWDQLRLSGGMLGSWVGIIAYALQIYFDFSGYSDMARGLGRMLGFEFLENFNYPYISATITEFWRRWHISLSTWFKEYVYIPLGGNRKGLKRQVLNLAIVWSLTGLWHGANWNFLLWGMYYALLLICEKLFLLKVLEKCPKVLGHVYSLIAILLGWSLFYFEDLGALGRFFTELVSFRATDGHSLRVIIGHLPLLLAAAVASTPLLKNLADRYSGSAAVRWGKIALCMVFLGLCVASLASQSYNPFIYFRF